MKSIIKPSYWLIKHTFWHIMQFADSKKAQGVETNNLIDDKICLS
jgi:hypothetical protein